MKSVLVLVAAALFNEATAFKMPRASILPRTTRTRAPRRTANLNMMAEGEFGEDLGKTAVTSGGINTAGEPPIEIRGFSLAKAFLYGGLGITVLSFSEYLTADGGAGLSSLGFIYGIPIILIGAALQYAELEPAGVQLVQDNAETLFESKATATMKQIFKDVTRHRYGDEAHLDTSVKALGLVMPQKDYPQLQRLILECAEGGEVAMTMVFQSKDTPYKKWAEEAQVKKFDTFFGPGLWSEVTKIDPVDRILGVKLTTGERPASKPITTEAAAEAASA